ncbi:MAG: helix-turn-helix transcriptional regulator [Muribaculaceae bacterium]|nr:helix-turn-helix transcriptional regulator [Muribaculaceae bacterium]
MLKKNHIARWWLLVLLVAVWVMADAQSHGHSQWLQLSSNELAAMGQKDMRPGQPKDTALMCYTIVAGRYERSMTQEQKAQCIDANMQLWRIYYYDYYDYPKCFECLSHARDIAAEAGIDNANIAIGLGCMYQTISEETGNNELGAKALRHYRDALATAMRTGDLLHADMACTDVLTMSLSQGGLRTVEAEWQKYAQLPTSPESGVLRRYNRLLHTAYSHIEAGRYRQALATYDQQLTLIDTTQYSRLIYFTCVQKAKAYAQQDHYQQAIATLERPEEIALSLQMKDCQLEVWGLLTDYYQRLGDATARAHYRERYLALRDTLNNYHQLASVSEAEARSEIKQLEHEMAEVKHHREVMSIITLALLGIVALVSVFVYFLYRKNAALKRSNRSLYQKNVEMLRAEEEERRMRRALQASAPPQPSPQEAEASETVKYRGSTLSDNDKTELLSRILDVMENNAEIFSPEFSLERLAALADSKYKYVSQVIHEHSNQNFNNFLNEYRIKEACKRISDIEHYGQYTIEAISAGVGFKSRSTFVTSFKRVTGLTPSQYQRLARDDSDSGN